MRLRSLLLTTTLTTAPIVVPIVASATTITGPYLDTGAGYNLVQNQHIHANTPADGPAVRKFQFQHNTGYTGFASFGWGFGNGLRVEAEGVYDASHINYGANNNTSDDDDRTATSTLAAIPASYAAEKWGGATVTDPDALPDEKVYETWKDNTYAPGESVPIDCASGLTSDDKCDYYGGGGTFGEPAPVEGHAGFTAPELTPGTYNYRYTLDGKTYYQKVNVPEMDQGIGPVQYIEPKWMAGSWKSGDTKLPGTYSDEPNPQKATQVTPPGPVWTLPDTGDKAHDQFGNVGDLPQPYGPANPSPYSSPENTYPFLNGPPPLGPDNSSPIYSLPHYNNVTQGYNPYNGDEGSDNYNLGGNVYGGCPAYMGNGDDCGQYYHGYGTTPDYPAKTRSDDIIPPPPKVNWPTPFGGPGKDNSNLGPGIVQIPPPEKWGGPGKDNSNLGPGDGLGLPEKVVIGHIVHREEHAEPEPSASGTGRAHSIYHNTGATYGVLANVFYDVDLQQHFKIKSPLTPFVGVGAGYLWQRYNNVMTSMSSGNAIHGTNGSFAYQGIVGMAYDTGIKGLQVTAEYRMISQPGSFYSGPFYYGSKGGHANFDDRWNHQFIVGLRYAL